MNYAVLGRSSIALFKNKRVLLVAAHPDDIESGCGGTISKYSNCNEIHSIVFAPCLEDPLNAGILKEFQRAMEMLGREQSNISFTETFLNRATNRLEIYYMT